MKYVLYILSFLLLEINVHGQVVLIEPSIRSVAVLVQFKNYSGSGFYLNDSNQVYFVTAYHVLFNSVSKTFYEDSLILISYRKDVENDDKSILKLSLTQAQKSGNVRYDRRNDIVIIKIATMIPLDSLGNQSVCYFPYAQKMTGASWVNYVCSQEIIKFSEVTAGSDIYIIGYPKSLRLQGSFDLDRPLFRKGIVAGKDVRRQRIIGDGAVYFGNSGGAVFQLYFDSKGKAAMKLIGIVSEYIPFEDILVDMTYSIRSIDTKNSGYSVITPAEKIFQLLF